MDRRNLLIGGVALLPLLPALPALPPGLPTRIAFGSCMHQSKPQPIWEAVLRWRPDLFLFLGDNVYGDVSSPDCRELLDAYAVAEGIPGLAAVRERVPHLATWDDHDYGGDDAGGGVPWQDRAQALFCDYWRLPADDLRRRRAGVYAATTFGAAALRVQVVLLDTRCFRSAWRPTDHPDAPGRQNYIADDDPNKTMLGDAQWAWLQACLAEPADLRIIGSSIQVLSDAHGFERWGLFPAERRRLARMLSAPGIGDVLLLSGDRHFGAMYRRADLCARPLLEVTSSGINMVYAKVTAKREPDPDRLHAPYAAENFGTIELDPAARLLHLAVRGMDGRPVRSLTTRLASAG